MEQPGNPGSIRGTRDRVFARREGSAYDTTSSDFPGRVRQRVARRLLFNFVYKNFWSRATETLERSRRAEETTATTGKTRLEDRETFQKLFKKKSVRSVNKLCSKTLYRQVAEIKSHLNNCHPSPRSGV